MFYCNYSNCRNKLMSSFVVDKNPDHIQLHFVYIKREYCSNNCTRIGVLTLI